MENTIIFLYTCGTSVSYPTTISSRSLGAANGLWGKPATVLLSSSKPCCSCGSSSLTAVWRRLIASTSPNNQTWDFSVAENRPSLLARKSFHHFLVSFVNTLELKYFGMSDLNFSRLILSEEGAIMSGTCAGKSSCNISHYWNFYHWSECQNILFT